MTTEAKTYSDGTVATGTAPLPAKSPLQQGLVAQLIGAIEDYGQWLWDAGYSDSPSSEMLSGDSAERLEEMRQRIDAIQQDAYAEGRKDQAEEQPMPDGALKLLDECMFYCKQVMDRMDAEDREGMAQRLHTELREFLIDVGYIWKSKA